VISRLVGSCSSHWALEWTRQSWLSASVATAGLDQSGEQCKTRSCQFLSRYSLRRQGQCIGPVPSSHISPTQACLSVPDPPPKSAPFELDHPSNCHSPG